MVKKTAVNPDKSRECEDYIGMTRWDRLCQLKNPPKLFFAKCIKNYLGKEKTCEDFPSCNGCRLWWMEKQSGPDDKVFNDFLKELEEDTY